jgi:hypothetical protein
MSKIAMIILEFFNHVPIHDGMSSGQLRETLLKKPLLYIRWVAGDGYVRGLRLIGHIDVIVLKNPLATTRCAGRKSEMADWNGPGNFSNRQPLLKSKSAPPHRGSPSHAPACCDAARLPQRVAPGPTNMLAIPAALVESSHDAPSVAPKPWPKVRELLKGVG